MKHQEYGLNDVEWRYFAAKDAELPEFHMNPELLNKILLEKLDEEDPVIPVFGGIDFETDRRIAQSLDFIQHVKQKRKVPGLPDQYPNTIIEITSTGGMVIPGFHILEQIYTFPGPVVGHVTGYGYSCAAIILQACRTRMMGEYSELMIHTASGFHILNHNTSRGEKYRQAKELLDRYHGQITNIFVNRILTTKENTLSEHDVRKIVTKLMKQEKMIGAEEAKRYHLIDTIVDVIPSPERRDEMEKHQAALHMRQMQETLKAFGIQVVPRTPENT